MMPGSNPPALPAPPARAARRGCLFYGLLAIAVLGFLLLLLVGTGFYAAKKLTHRLVQDYTDPAPSGLVEKVQYSPAQMDALKDRLAAFKRALDKGQTAEELVLSADDLNAWINDQKDLRGKLFVRIEDERLKGDVSFPLSDIGPLKLSGRYLNGTAAFKLRLTNGLADLRLDEVQVKSKPLPKVILSELKKQNLALQFENDPDTAATVARFDSVQITNGQLVLRTKAGAGQ